MVIFFLVKLFLSFSWIETYLFCLWSMSGVKDFCVPMQCALMTIKLLLRLIQVNKYLCKIWIMSLRTPNFQIILFIYFISLYFQCLYPDVIFTSHAFMVWIYVNGLACTCFFSVMLPSRCYGLSKFNSITGDRSQSDDDSNSNYDNDNLPLSSSSKRVKRPVIVQEIDTKCSQDKNIS